MSQIQPVATASPIISTKRPEPALNPAKAAIDLIVQTEQRLHSKILAQVKIIEGYQNQNERLIHLNKELCGLEDDATLSDSLKQMATELDLFKDNMTVAQLKSVLGAKASTLKSQQEIAFATQIQPSFQFANSINEVAQSILRQNNQFISKTMQHANGG